MGHVMHLNRKTDDQLNWSKTHEVGGGRLCEPGGSGLYRKEAESRRSRAVVERRGAL